MVSKIIIKCCIASLLLFFSSNVIPYDYNKASAASNENEEKSYLIRLKPTSDANKWMTKKGFNQQKVKKMKKVENTLFTKVGTKEYGLLKVDPDVEFIEEDKRVSITSVKETSNGETSTEQTPWGIAATQADYAHNNSYLGKGIKIAVLDTGVMSQHPDLKIAGGQSFIEGSKSFEDDNGHGTHVAGIIGAQHNNIGVVGMAPNAEIYALKVLDATGSGYYSSVIQAIDWSISNGMNIISMSFGGNEYSEMLHLAIQEASTKYGILFVAAAGNAGLGKETETYPALYPEVISVGALNSMNKRSDFSSTGSELDIMAPGENILSTDLNGGYRERTGTSFSVPYIAGAAALIWSSDLNLKSDQIKDKILVTPTVLGDAHEYGKGIVNVMKALNYSSNSEGNFGSTTSLSVSNLISSLLRLKSKAITQNKIEIAKEIYDFYNELNIEYSRLSQFSQNINEQNNALVDAENKVIVEELRAKCIELINKYAKSLDTPADLSVAEYDVSDKDKMGNWQTISPGESVTVTVAFPKYQGHANVNVWTPEGTTIDESSSTDGSYHSYTWHTSESTPPGVYTIQMYNTWEWVNEYSRFDTSFTVYVVSATKSISEGESVNFNIIPESYQLFEFTTNETKTVTFDTLNVPNGDIDTVISIYNNNDLRQEFAYNDDANGSQLSSISLTLFSNSTIYIKVENKFSLNSISGYLRVQETVNQFTPLVSGELTNQSFSTPIAKLYSFTPSITQKYTLITGELCEWCINNTSLYLSDTANLNNYIASSKSNSLEYYARIDYELLAGTTYYIVLTGDQSFLDFGFAITPFDEIDPTAPVQLTGTREGSTVTLNWNDSTDNVGVVGYDIYLGTYKLKSVESNIKTYTVKGLEVNNTYKFTVKARDASWNQSDSSNSYRSVVIVGSLSYVYDKNGRLEKILFSNGNVFADFKSDNNGNTQQIKFP
ncbi:S8 family serine peptidase [Paenibacillus oryzisoli]|uniref:S8 family serine peptidase n=1 Tax=Paenibacillus oryzisoli TaxID=1850517 RepID=UPI003D2941DF